MRRTVMLVMLVASCGGNPGSRGGSSGPAIGTYIPDPPECPAPPGVTAGSAARRWVHATRDVGHTAGDHVMRGIEEAERRKDPIWVACLREKHAAIESASRRIGAEKMVLGGGGGERTVARVRLHCLRIQRLVEEARHCIADDAETR